MNDSTMTRACRKVWRSPRKAVLAMRFWWRHGPLSAEAAERVDRICNPKKYLCQVNAVAKV